MACDFCHVHLHKPKQTMTTQFAIPSNALFVTDTEPFTALVFTTRTTLSGIPQLGHVPTQLYEKAHRLGLSATGPIQYVYADLTSDATNEFQLDIALPVATSMIQPEPFSLKNVERFRCVCYTFTGAWDAFGAMYDALFAAIQQAGYTPNNQIREVYSVVDFDNPTQCVTDIQVGLV